jgi:hypothetical protein
MLEWIIGLYIYLLVAAYLLGENIASDNMRARNGVPHGWKRNLLWVAIWPVMLIERYIYDLRH